MVHRGKLTQQFKHALHPDCNPIKYSPMKTKPLNIILPYKNLTQKNHITHKNIFNKRRAKI